MSGTGLEWLRIGCNGLTWVQNGLKRDALGCECTSKETILRRFIVRNVSFFLSFFLYFYLFIYLFNKKTDEVGRCCVLLFSSFGSVPFFLFDLI